MLGAAYAGHISLGNRARLRGVRLESHMGKKVLVIGAGIAGLSAASYLQRNGFDTEVFELHDKPGGLCAAWTRKGYTFDGCIHWLMGSGPSSNLHKIWKDLGAGNLTYVEWNEHIVVHLPDGDTFTVFTDPDRLKAEILRLGPEDVHFARLFSSKIKAVVKTDMPAAFDKLSFKEALAFFASIPSAIPILAKWMKTPLQRLVDELKSDKLRGAFSVLFGNAMRDFPAGALFMMIGFMAKKSAGYPLGGSLAFARAIESKYLSLGGMIHYRAKIDKILVEEGRAVGVKGSWGESRGDYVISAADGRDTLDRLLGGDFSDCAMNRAFNVLKPYPSLLFVSLGLNHDCSELPHAQIFELKEPLVFEDGALTIKHLSLRVFNFDATLAPHGKTSAIVMFQTDNDTYWSDLATHDPVAYASKKKAIADAVIAAINKKIAGFASWVEVVDVATPKTFINYTNNWRGSYEGWLPTSSSLGKKIPRTIPGLKGFFMVGQWVNPGGGLPPCGIDGRNIAKLLCKAEGKRFKPD
jgi:phytoene dehydrogenase-like protein